MAQSTSAAVSGTRTPSAILTVPGWDMLKFAGVSGMGDAEDLGELSGWMRMKGAAVRGWKRMHFRLRGQQLSYSKTEEGLLGAVIQLAGCSVCAETGGGEQHVLCISHTERGTRKLACDSAGSLSVWLTALQTAALPTAGAASPHRGQRVRSRAEEADARDGAFAHLSRARLSNSLDELRASGVLEASRHMLQDEHGDEHAADMDPSEQGWASSSDERQTLTLAQSLAERDEACGRAAGLIQQMIALERRCRDAESDLLLKKRSETGKVEAAQEAIMAMERERKETIRVSEERQVTPPVLQSAPPPTGADRLASA
jgi:hypothetical protein